MVATLRQPQPGPRRRKRQLPLLMELPPRPRPRYWPRLTLRERRGSPLRVHAWTDLCEEEVDGLNLTSGCAHQCAFCCVRSSPGYPGDGELILYKHTAEALRTELASRQCLPRAVFLSPSSDPFPPFAEVQAETGRVLEVLAEFGVPAWFMTRGHVRPSMMEMLERHKKVVRITVAITTTDRDLSRVLEPWAAPPRMRLRQLRQLRERGIATQVAIEPLIPGLTDVRQNLEPLVDALGSVGVERVTTSYLFLREGMKEQLDRDLAEQGWSDAIRERFAGGPVLPMGRIAPARHLPRADRQAGYALLMTLAARHGIQVKVNGLTNPDFRPRREMPRAAQTLRQLLLQYPR